jgi:hypothetical protein
MASMNNELVASDNTNAQPLFCRHCGSQFLGAGKARSVDHELTMVHLQRVAGSKAEAGAGAEEPAIAVEVVASCWRVDDMWDFE